MIVITYPRSNSQHLMEWLNTRNISIKVRHNTNNISNIRSVHVWKTKENQVISKMRGKLAKQAPIFLDHCTHMAGLLFWFLKFDLELKMKSCELQWVLASDVTVRMLSLPLLVCGTLDNVIYLSVSYFFLPWEHRWDGTGKDHRVNSVVSHAKFGIRGEKIRWIRQSHTHNLVLESLVWNT